MFHEAGYGGKILVGEKNPGEIVPLKKRHDEGHERQKT